MLSQSRAGLMPSCGLMPFFLSEAEEYGLLTTRIARGPAGKWYFCQNVRQSTVVIAAMLSVWHQF